MKVKHPSRWLLSILTAMVLLIFVEYRLNWTWTWTGFNKSLWDWMQLLIIPAALAVVAIWFNRVERRNEQDIASDNQQEAALQAYLDKMSELLLKEGLRKPETDNEVRKIGRARTLTVLRKLDPERKGSLLPFFLLILRLFGKKIYCVCHQVIADLNTVSGHINLQENGWRIWILNIFQKIFYLLMFIPINKAIVFDDALKIRLQRIIKHLRIVVIPLAVELFNTLVTREQARKQLNIPEENFVLLCFGFLAWYKGTDWLIQEFEIIPEEIKKDAIPNCV